MKRYRAFNALCAVLRAGLLDEHRSLDSPPQAPWPLLIELGSGHAVIPSVAWCLKGKTYIPHDVGDYFESVLTLNRIRNERMLEGLERIVAALNAIDIEPVLLKGAAHLVERLYPEPGLRVLGDLDLLIPEGRATSAVAALRDVGFTGTAHPPNDGRYHHHLPGLIDPESGLGVELHTRVVPTKVNAVVPTQWFCASTQSVLFRSVKVRIPDSTRSITHNISHSQIHVDGFHPDRTRLRNMLDFALIRRRSESAIDWAEINHRFNSAGFGYALAAYAQYCEAYLGQPAPPLDSSPRSLSLQRFRVAIERPDREARTRRRAERIRLSAECAALNGEREILRAERTRLEDEKYKLTQHVAALQHERNQLIVQTETLLAQRSVFIAIAAWARRRARPLLQVLKQHPVTVTLSNMLTRSKSPPATRAQHSRKENS